MTTRVQLPHRKRWAAWARVAPTTSTSKGSNAPAAAATFSPSESQKIAACTAGPWLLTKRWRIDVNGTASCTSLGVGGRRRSCWRWLGMCGVNGGSHADVIVVDDAV